MIRLDLCVLTDVRQGDVATPCHAALLAAVSDAGYRVGVLPVASAAITADPFGIDPAHAGLFNSKRIVRLGDGAVVDCTVALALDARLFEPGPLLRGVCISATHRIVTVERPAGLAAMRLGDLNRLASVAADGLGGPVTWAPNSRIARDAIMFAAPHWPTTVEDWAPVAPPVAAVSRNGLDRARPVVGVARIARTRPAAWPVGTGAGSTTFDTATVAWRACLGPTDPRPDWPRGAPIEVWPLDGTGIDGFLGRIDLLANDDRAEDDPVPVEVIIALSNGVVPFLGPEFRPMFGGAAIYGQPRDIVRAAVDLHGDRQLAQDMRDRGPEFVLAAFSAEAAVARIRALAGPPRGDSHAPEVLARGARRVLFYSTNGVGMGHLTRQLAIARRLPPHLKPVFLSHSQAVDVARGYGFPAEHLPYHASYGERPEHWNHALAASLQAAFDFYDPAALVFDGNVPFVGLIDALAKAPDIARIWVRRSLWGLGRDLDALERGTTFDLVLEPGELAWAHDTGSTTAFRDQVRNVPPVRILDADEMLSRADACDELQLDPSAVNVLVATGSGNNSASDYLMAAALTHLYGRYGIGLAVAEWKIARHEADLPAGVARLSGYPFARLLAAFDFAIAAAGYNSFVEHVAVGLPTIWTPNEHPEQDRQIDRAKWAKARGLGLMVRLDGALGLVPAIDRMLNTDERAAMRAAALGLPGASRTNGAADAAAAVADLAGTVVSRTSAVTGLVAGHYIPFGTRAIDVSVPTA